MIWIALVLAVVGLALSAFFSGSETGFYRVTRIRLVLDALGGSLIARWLLWMTNRPSLFIATTLVGNNLANYLVSLSVVLGTQALLVGGSHAAELCAPLVLAPVLFVYGELLPKNLFLNAPNRLLRVAGPFFMVFVPLFLPVSLFLWGLNWLLARGMGVSPEKIRLTMARHELHHTLEEGHETGILLQAQRELAQGIFAVAKDPVTDYAMPLDRAIKARDDMSKKQVRKLARRFRLATVPVVNAADQQHLEGYVRAIDLGLDPAGRLGPVQPILEIPATATLIDAVMTMHVAQQTIAQVITADGRSLGLVSAERLREPLLSSKR